MSEQAKSSASEPAAGLNVQQQYWDAWLSLLRQSLEQTGEFAGQAPAAEAMRRWWEAVAPSFAKTDATDLFEKVMPQGQAYLSFGEQTLKVIETLQDSYKGDGDWQKTLQQSFETLRETFFQPFQGQSGAHPGLAAFWGLPLDTWQRVASSLSIFPGDTLQAMRIQGYRPAGLQEGLEKALETPTIGYTREWQEQLQQNGRLWRAYQEAYWQYSQLLQRSAQRALNRLQEKLSKMAQEDKAVDSLRGLYNLWVDCSEEAYGETVRSPEYSEAYGRMINTLMRFKQHSQLMINETLSALNIPNRMELDTAHARLQQTRRNLRELRDGSGVTESGRMEQWLGQLQEEVITLREEMRSLKTASAAKKNPKRRASASTKTRKKTQGE